MVLDKFGESFKSEFLELVREVVTDGHRPTWRHLSCAYVVVTPCLTASVGPPVKTGKNYPFKNVVAASEVSLYSVLLHWGPATGGGRRRSGVCCRSSQHLPGSPLCPARPIRPFRLSNRHGCGRNLPTSSAWSGPPGSPCPLRALGVLHAPYRFCLTDFLLSQGLRTSLTPFHFLLLFSWDVLPLRTWWDPAVSRCRLLVIRSSLTRESS